MNILAFPFEIQEKILGYLDITDLASAAKSCGMWRRIGNDRLFKRWCLKNISPDVLNEITENQFSGTLGSSSSVNVNDGFDWENLCTKWSKTACISACAKLKVVPDSETENATRSPMTVTKCCVCMAVTGDLVVIGDHFNNVVWYDCNGQKVAEKGNFGEPVLNIGLLNICRREPYEVPNSIYTAEHDAAIVVSHEFIAIYSMPTWNCQELYFLNVRHGTKSISVQGNQFAYYNGYQNLMTVCVVRRRPRSQCDSMTNLLVYPWTIQVKARCSFSTTYNVHNWKLWKNSVICLLQNGTVMTWDIDEETASQSIFISDFLYPFESFLYRGLIFCNISTARALLHYWHVNMGAPHWLVSTDGLTFRRMNTSLSCGDEITTIHIKRTVIVAGTDCGRICIYRHTGSDHDIPDAMLQGPSLVYKIANTPIFKCDFSLDGENMVILAKTAANTLLLLKLPVTEKYY